MEENINTQNQAQITQQQVPSMSASEPQTATGVAYVGFGKRFVALLIDAILIGIVSSILGMGRGNCYNGYCDYGLNPLGSLIGWAYFVVMDVKFGATLGKLVMKIRVVKEETGENLDWGSAILREVVGKLLSSIVLCLGYLWVIWDDKKQAWHDKIAGSIVIEGETKLEIAKPEEKKEESKPEVTA